MISIVIPVYNENESLLELYSSIDNIFKTIGEKYEIIFVNDGSTDCSQEIIDKIAENNDSVHSIVFRRNFGKSAALNAGFENVSCDIVFTMDADLQDDPSEIPKFIEEIEKGADLVTGWKKNRLDPLEKTIPSKIFNAITSKMSGLKLNDYNCGFKCYRKELLKEIDIYGEMHRFTPFLAHKKGFNVKEISINHRKRKFGRSKFGFERYARGFFDLLTVVFITNYLTRPLHLFGAIGAVFLGSGVLVFLYLFLGRWIFGQSIGTSPLFALSIFSMGIGAQIFVVGLLAELVVHNKERDRKKNYSILSKDIENR